MKQIKPLWDVQKKAVEFCLARPASMLNMDMGTGKTRVAIEVIKESNAQKILVVAPKSVVPVWQREIDKYTTDPFEVLELGSGSVKQRSHALHLFLNKSRTGPAVVVINYDTVWRDLLKNYLELIDWDLMILDESHRAKSASSRTSQACFRIGKKAKRRLCLSGTPMANSPLDVFGQYRFLDNSIFGTGWHRFTDQYAIRGGPERRFIVGFRNLEELGDKFQTIAYTCTKDDIKLEAGLLDPPESFNRFGELGHLSKPIYRDLKKDFVAEVGQGLIAPSTVLVRLLRFQQITSGFVETTDLAGQNKEIRRLDPTKQNMLREIIEDIPHREPIVVFYKFRQDLAMIRELATTNKPVFEMSGDRNELSLWEARDNAILAIQYQAGNAGIDLTKASYIVYYSLTYSLAEYQQSQARVYRPGQKKPVTMTHLIIKDTIDEQIMHALETKQNIIDVVLARPTTI